VQPFQYLYPIKEFDFHRPLSVKEALQMLDQLDEPKVIAGGTDLTIALKYGLVNPKNIIDLSALNELKYIVENKDEIRIGSLTTFDEIDTSELIKEKLQSLWAASHNVGTWQIRTLATIGGNLANGSPAADSAPPLIVHDASVLIRSINNERMVPITAFFTGPKRTVLKSNELITEIRMPKFDTKSWWMRIGRRQANTISVVSVAVSAEIADSKFMSCKIALGSVAPTPILALKASEFLKGKEVTEENITAASDLASKESSPITDIRGSAQYRRVAVKVLTQRILKKLVE